VGSGGRARLFAFLAAGVSLTSVLVVGMVLVGRAPNPTVSEGIESRVVETASNSQGTDCLPQKARYSPPPVQTPEFAAFVDRNARGRVTPDITSRIPRIRDDEDVPAVVSVLLDTEDDDTVRNEAANLLRRSEYPALTDDLLRGRQKIT
jgi:hypothetical protein